MTEPASPILNYASRKDRTSRLKTFSRKAFYAALFLALIVGAGMATYFLQPARYVAIGFLQFTGTGSIPYLNAQSAGEAGSLISPSNLAGAIALATGPMSKWTVPQYRLKLEVVPIADSKLIMVQCTDSSPQSAADGVNMLIWQAMGASKLQWCTAQSASAPIAPHRNPLWALLGSIGMIVCFLAWRAWKDQELRER